MTKELTLHLDGDFNAPNFSNVSPQDGTVQLLESKMELSLSFKVTDDSGLDSVYVEEPILGIMERIKLNGEKEYSFNKTYSLPSKPEEYELKITAIDNFVEANRKTQKIKYIVSSEMVTLFLADVPKGTDLTADVCGVPMLYHKKSMVYLLSNIMRIVIIRKSTFWDRRALLNLTALAYQKRTVNC